MNLSIKASRAFARLFFGAVALIALTACGSGDGPSQGAAQPSTIRLSTVSAKAMMVSGDDVVVEASLPPGTADSTVAFKLNDLDVTDSFITDSTTGKRRGLLTGLKPGANTLTAVAAGQAVARLELKNFPAFGPIFSGARQSPWICETAASGLGAAPASGPCVAATRYDWFYRTTGGTFAPLPSLTGPYPPDLAKTVTTEGNAVDYIVRVESGTINESIYRVAVLDNPANAIHDPWSKTGKKPGTGWNGKLYYPFGGGAAPGFRSGSNEVTSALLDLPLSLGFAVAFGTRNTYGNGFDDVLSAETLMMIKERFIEHYGLPRFTIGSGGSGGSLQQHLIAQNYPGLLDGIIPSASFAELAGPLISSVSDCGPLNNYFNKLAADPSSWTGIRRSAVDGGAVADVGPAQGMTVCQNNWLGFVPAIYAVNPVTFSPVVPVSLRYDPVNNPTGARGTFWDGNVNSFGRDSRTGFARSAYDNVGVQYGLLAVNAGAITPEEFVDLNEKVGGIDIDGKLTPNRSTGDPLAVKRGYASGRVVTSFVNMTLPIIEFRNYSDNLGDIHTRERTLTFLERLKKANGTAANQVTWLAGLTGAPDFDRMALLGMNDWLERLAADTSDLSYPARVINSKPPGLKDACWIGGVKTEEVPSWDPGAVCNQAMPVHSNTRLQAGAPRTDDVVMCKLKPIDFSSWSVAFTDAQKARLSAAFPRGVCDWQVPGEGQVPHDGPWIDFSAGAFGPANIYN
ncbi:DUF6351 family protein [Variovorax sp. J22R133]|uniref:DUF6351 family protein n=1 Tax=Variovorax brevis TaxID=3053503 RepID=UPI00257736B2|nr:DUF6351 family protein [Variovorax sp. J22R133]MDM0111849.1 DUF6351 family protein [Variovorax sp. J22R133]